MAIKSGITMDLGPAYEGVIADRTGLPAKPRLGETWWIVSENGATVCTSLNPIEWSWLGTVSVHHTVNPGAWPHPISAQPYQHRWVQGAAGLTAPIDGSWVIVGGDLIVSKKDADGHDVFLPTTASQMQVTPGGQPVVLRHNIVPIDTGSYWRLPNFFPSVATPTLTGDVTLQSQPGLAVVAGKQGDLWINEADHRTWAYLEDLWVEMSADSQGVASQSGQTGRRVGPTVITTDVAQLTPLTYTPPIIPRPADLFVNTNDELSWVAGYDKTGVIGWFKVGSAANGLPPVPTDPDGLALTLDAAGHPGWKPSVSTFDYEDVVGTPTLPPVRKFQIVATNTATYESVFDIGTSKWVWQQMTGPLLPAGGQRGDTVMNVAGKPTWVSPMNRSMMAGVLVPTPDATKPAEVGWDKFKSVPLLKDLGEFYVTDIVGVAPDGLVGIVKDAAITSSDQIVVVGTSGTEYGTAITPWKVDAALPTAASQAHRIDATHWAVSDKDEASGEMLTPFIPGTSIRIADITDRTKWIEFEIKAVTKPDATGLWSQLEIVNEHIGPGGETPAPDEVLVTSGWTATYRLVHDAPVLPTTVGHRPGEILRLVRADPITPDLEWAFQPLPLWEANTWHKGEQVIYSNSVYQALVDIVATDDAPRREPKVTIDQLAVTALADPAAVTAANLPAKAVNTLVHYTGATDVVVDGVTIKPGMWGMRVSSDTTGTVETAEGDQIVNGWVWKSTQPTMPQVFTPKWPNPTNPKWERVVGGIDDSDPKSAGAGIGSISMFPLAQVPDTHLVVDGRKFDVAKYPDLFKYLGSDTLPDLRDQFVRGWSANRAPMSKQTQSTAMPANRFTTAPAGKHRHGVDNSKFGTDESGSGWLTCGDDPRGGMVWGEGLNFIQEAGEHTHNVNGGDPETRPANVALVYAIQALPLTVFTELKTPELIIAWTPGAAWPKNSVVTGADGVIWIVKENIDVTDTDPPKAPKWGPLYAKAEGAGTGIGQIAMFPKTAVPPTHLVCDGARFAKDTYPDLFDYLGVDAVPDLRDAFIRGWSATRQPMSKQAAATAMPTNPFVTTAAGGHKHIHGVPAFKPYGSAYGFASDVNTTGLGGSGSDQRGDPYTSSALDHTHPITGGDTETRPANTALVLAIQALPLAVVNEFRDPKTVVEWVAGIWPKGSVVVDAGLLWVAKADTVATDPAPAEPAWQKVGSDGSWTIVDEWDNVSDSSRSFTPDWSKFGLYILESFSTNAVFTKSASGLTMTGVQTSHKVGGAAYSGDHAANTERQLAPNTWMNRCKFEFDAHSCGLDMHIHTEDSENIIVKAGGPSTLNGAFTIRWVGAGTGRILALRKKA